MSGYIMDLRKIVGHRTLLQVGASVIVENGDGQILLQKRKDNHCWAYAGGSVELDEVVEDAARRARWSCMACFPARRRTMYTPTGMRSQRLISSMSAGIIRAS